MYREIGREALGCDRELRVQLAEVRGHRPCVYVREWAKRDGDQAVTPQRGPAIPISLLPWLRAQLEAAEREALRARLLEPEDYTDHDLPLPPELRMQVA
jgi:hypothetical protein